MVLGRFYCSMFIPYIIAKLREVIAYLLRYIVIYDICRYTRSTQCCIKLSIALCTSCTFTYASHTFLLATYSGYWILDSIINNKIYIIIYSVLLCIR